MNTPKMPVVHLRRGKDDNILRFHPWIFSGAIAAIDGIPEEGDLVKVVNHEGTFRAIGHFQSGSIMVRILSFTERPIDRTFYCERILAAYEMRKSLQLERSDNNTYRLIHGEGDGLPGLVVDKYGETAIVQAHSIGMHFIRQMLAEIIVDTIPEVKNVFYKSTGTLPSRAGLQVEDEYLIGNDDEALGLENGLRFKVDWLKGQKTGFFIDQRDNRMLLEHYAKGRKVLNMFCYTGGFSCYAMRGGAELVHSVDSSSKAISLVDKNMAMNFPEAKNHASFAEDAFQFLDNMKESYDLIILDPPAFAKHRSAIHNALQGYRRLNAKAFEKIPHGGILFTFSCSQAVSREQFRLAVFTAAAQSKRNVRILHQLTQPIDHPVNIYHPEGEYLKGLVLYVE